MLLISPKLSRNVSFKLRSPLRQHIVDLIAEGINYLRNYPVIIENSFRVCGITTNDPRQVNDKFLKKVINSVKYKLVDEELLEDEDDYVYNRIIMICSALLTEFLEFLFLVLLSFSLI